MCIRDRPTAAKNREKTIPSNAQNSNNDNINGFSIYYYDDVVRASNFYNRAGIDGIGLSYKKDFEKNTIAVLIVGSVGILLIIGTKKRNKKRLN